MIPLSRPIIGSAELQAVAEVLKSGMLAMGPEVAAFEEEFSHFVAGRECIAVNSGTSALHLLMSAHGIGRGHEVVVPSFTFAATANAVRLAGAEPVFVDVDPDTWGLVPEQVAAAVTDRTAAVLAVHLYGQPASIAELSAVADRHGLLLLEDAAQAHAAEWEGRPVGSLGDGAAFSFYPTKNMTTGEGGMVVVEDRHVARMVRLLRNQGMEQRYANEIVGHNVRMTDLGAAIGRVQLRRLREWTEARRANAAHYDARLRGVTVPARAAGATHVFHQYTLRVDDREGLRVRLAGEGIASGVYYPTPVHRLPSFGLEFALPNTEIAAREVLSIPVRPDLTVEERKLIVDVVNGWSS